MLAESSRIRARAFETDFFGIGKKAGFRVGDDRHYLIGDTTFEQFNDGSDFAGAFGFDGFPSGGSEGRDGNENLVNTRSGAHDFSFDFASLDLEVEDKTVCHIATTPGKAVFVIAKGLDVFAPAFAPERSSDFASFNDDGRGLAF